MKSGSLLQSLLLVAGLVVGGIPAVQADHAYPANPGSGKYHYLLKDKRSSGHTPWWSSSYHGKHNPKHHWKHDRGGGHDLGRWQYGRYDSRSDGRDHGERWKHGRFDGHGSGRDQKGHRQHGNRDGWGDAGRKGQRSRSAGIGYTGRS
jgi:hypothetical protein